MKGNKSVGVTKEELLGPTAFLQIAAPSVRSVNTPMDYFYLYYCSLFFLSMT